jgi:hypothetical protein
VDQGKYALQNAIGEPGRRNAAVPEGPQHSFGMKRSPLVSNKFAHRGPAGAAARAAVKDGTG